jgi:Na+/melibiose symporter-like transporter
MTPLIVSQWTYVVVSAAVTIWVARSLHRSGRPFLVQSFHGDKRLASSINDLLVVGFYLLNFGYVALTLRYGAKPENPQAAIEFVATKIGLVLVILAALHFFNLVVFSQIGKRPARQLAPGAPGGREKIPIALVLGDKT